MTTVTLNGIPVPAATYPVKAPIWRRNTQPRPLLIRWPAKHKRVGRLWRRVWVTTLESAPTAGATVTLQYEAVM